MMKKRYLAPALIAGLALLGGSTAYAFGPGGFDIAAFSSFTSDEQEAIEKANDIRAAAEEEARAVLDAAGVTQDELHDAMKAYQGARHEKVDAALEANDYTAFKEAVANSPMAGDLTEEVFAKLVQVHALEKSGDREGARALRQELGLKGPGMGMGPEGHGPRPTDK